MTQQDKPGKAPNVLQIVGSVLAAAFGVQSNENRLRDFQHGNIWAYIVVGAVATLLFVLLIYGTVRLVLG